ncbi:MAG: hypothetical protein QNI96_07120, partial [Woeseiaceae bacterium]|nr:hypothetical protein [Woeseiaceae bacterium]
MHKTDSAADNRYLFKRNNTWWVKVAVPRPLRKTLGYDLRRSLHTQDIEAAREARWPAVEQLRSKIDELRADPGGQAATAAPAADTADDATRQVNQGYEQVNQHIVEIVSDSGEGAQKCGQILGLVSGKMGNGVWTVEIIPAEIQPP